MEQSVQRAEAEKDIKRILQGVMENEDRIVIEQDDQPVAVIVPVGVYWQWLRSQEFLADKLREMAQEFGMSEEEAEVNELAEEAKWWVRRKRKDGTNEREQ
jgi:hypothetical protein